MIQFGKKNRRNLVMVARSRNRYQIDDFQRIASIIRQKAPDIVPVVCLDRIYNRLRPDLLIRHSYFFAPLQHKRLDRIRGAITQGINFSKSEEYRAMEAIGIPVPEWQLLTQANPRPCPGVFGKYVVTKPDAGGRGAEVKIKRCSRVKWKPPQNRMSLVQRNRNLVIQKFVYTGPWPTSYRVTTLFGIPLFAWKVSADNKRRPLDGPDEFGSGGKTGGGYSICSSGAGCRFELIDDVDVLDLAAQAHRAFPDSPVLGVDIIREQPSNKLYVIELNSGGGTWHFSSSAGKSIERDFDLNLEAQFDGLARAAEVLVEQTRKRAA
jgi:hypothetical protein